MSGVVWPAQSLDGLWSGVEATAGSWSSMVFRENAVAQHDLCLVFPLPPLSFSLPSWILTMFSLMPLVVFLSLSSQQAKERSMM
jgi:hypothetical protein